MENFLIGAPMGICLGAIIAVPILAISVLRLWCEIKDEIKDEKERIDRIERRRFAAEIESGKMGRDGNPGSQK